MDRILDAMYDLSQSKQKDYLTEFNSINKILDINEEFEGNRPDQPRQYNFLHTLNSEWADVFVKHVSCLQFNHIILNAILELNASYNYLKFTEFVQDLSELRKCKEIDSNVRKGCKIYINHIYGAVNHPQSNLLSIPNWHDIIVSMCNNQVFAETLRVGIDISQIISIDTDEVYFYNPNHIEMNSTKFQQVNYKGGVFKTIKERVLWTNQVSPHHSIKFFGCSPCKED